MVEKEVRQKIRNKEETSENTKPVKEMWRLGTWNIISINGKKVELLQEFTKTELDILTIIETKKKDKGNMELEGEHLLY